MGAASPGRTWSWIRLAANTTSCSLANAGAACATISEQTRAPKATGTPEQQERSRIAVFLSFDRKDEHGQCVEVSLGHLRRGAVDVGLAERVDREAILAGSEQGVPGRERAFLEAVREAVAQVVGLEPD